MKEYKLYLDPEIQQDLISDRWKHLFNQIDRENQTVRVYIAGVDVPRKELRTKPPYATLNDEPLRFADAFEMIMVKTGKAEDPGFFDGEL